MLTKDKHPISFESQKLKPNEQINSTYDKEMLAIMHAFVMWKQYLLVAKFIIKTNQNILKYFLT